jgi:glycosyltransferase involved in cell wall biosynthesis
LLSDYFENYREDRASFRARFQTAFEMYKLGHHVKFAYPDFGLIPGKKLITDGYTVQITPGLSLRRLRAGGFELIDMITESLIVLFGDYEVIHVSNGHRPCHFVPCLLCKLCRKSISVDECWKWLGTGGYADSRKGILGYIVGIYNRFFEIRLKRFFDYVVVIPTALKKRFGNRENLVVLHGGDENHSLIRYDAVEVRRSLGLPVESFSVRMSQVLLGDHTDNQVFFQAFGAMCRDEHDIYLVATGPDMNYIRDAAASHGFESNIVAPGYIDFVTYNKYLSAYDVFVLRYRNTVINRDRWPNKLGDYICLVRPVIANPTGDLRGLFENQKIGILCEHSAEAFYRTLVSLKKDRSYLAELSRDCGYIADEVLSFVKKVKALLQTLSSTQRLKHTTRGLHTQ